MIEHIVKQNENINDILMMYHVNFEELKHYNSHITDFKNLHSGIKLLIPLISEEVEQILEKTEGFVMDYYPKIDKDIIPLLNEEKKEETLEKKENIEPIRKEKQEPLANENLVAYPGIIPPKRPYKGRL